MTTLAEKVNELFETFKKEAGKEYTYREVQEGTNNAVTAAYIWKLRSGKADNPGYRVLQALGEFFGVPVGYFFDEKEGPDPGAARIALRARDLDEEGKQAIMGMIEYVRRAQGLEDG